MLSMLVCGKACEVHRDMIRLLSDEALADAQGGWAKVFSLLSEVHYSSAMVLIVSLMLQSCASWTFRVLEPCASFPMLFLKLLEEPMDAESSTRQDIAEMFLDMPDCCLKGCEGASSDVAFKLRKRFHDDFTSMRTSGKCTALLWTTLISIRSMLSADVQEIEGCNSLLQVMCSRAPNMSLPLASARLCIKKSTPLRPDECLALHGAVVPFLHSEAAESRFQPVPIKITTPFEFYKKPCAHCATPSKCLAVAAAKQAASAIILGATTVHVVSLATTGTSTQEAIVAPWPPVGSPNGVACSACLKHYSVVFCALGTIVTSSLQGDQATWFKLRMPIVIERLASSVAEIPHFGDSYKRPDAADAEAVTDAAKRRRVPVPSICVASYTLQ